MYPMTSRTKGRAVIICNHTFEHVPSSQERKDRLSLDATSLDVLFKKLHFKVKTHNNVTIKVRGDLQFY